MKVTGLALCPPPAALESPKVTPELLASCLARYSRSNKGIESILSSIDWGNPDKSVDSIFRFVDYGHASIAGMTGGIALVIDQCSMFLAYKLFEMTQLCDGQESSTRYIELSPSNLPDPTELGIPERLVTDWQSLVTRAFGIYHDVYSELTRNAQQHPELLRLPDGTDSKVSDRLRRNYALDRARYFIPLATKTNVALVMTARVWAQTIRQLDSLPQVEARRCAELLRAELGKFAPRLFKHSYREEACVEQLRQEIAACREAIRTHGARVDLLPDEVHLSLQRELPRFLPHIQTVPMAFARKTNRYSLVGEALRRMFVRVAWNNMAVAELRDLNRHRSGCKFTLLAPVGFYFPREVSHPGIASLLRSQQELVERWAEDFPDDGSHYYGYLLGTQTPFEHSTHADKFIYEVEVRTGMGAHFRYAEHLAVACREFLKLVPEAEPFVRIGTAEPE